MKTFKNKNFTKRDYECTNVVFCQADKAPNANWINAKEEEFTQMQAKGLTMLWIEAGVKYWGWM